MKDFIIRWLINTLALYAALALLDGRGITVQMEVWYAYAFLGFIFGVVNALLKPLLKMMTCSLIVLTLGLFTLVINTALFYLSGLIGQWFGFGFTVDNFWTAFIGALITSVVSVALNLFLNDKDDKKKRD
ncbi:MAG: phage holin family protein [Anaerolineaceae bacterium]|nr:phage holin family protein [Anaerolineaceae bacterium]